MDRTHSIVRMLDRFPPAPARARGRYMCDQTSERNDDERARCFHATVSASDDPEHEQTTLYARTGTNRFRKASYTPRAVRRARPVVWQMTRTAHCALPGKELRRARAWPPPHQSRHNHRRCHASIRADQSMGAVSPACPCRRRQVRSHSTAEERKAPAINGSRGAVDGRPALKL
jgi:hypothetical protein